MSKGEILMNTDANTAEHAEVFPELLAAELTIAAYPIALRHGVGDSWIDLEINLWMVLAEAVRKWQRQLPLPSWPGMVEGLLAELTDAAYRSALQFAPLGSFLEMELGLYQAFRRSLEPWGEQLAD
jgi:hypothetical protein